MKRFATCFVLSVIAVLAMAQTTTLSGLDPARFDSVMDGRKTGLYTLRNSQGMEACITNYGARLVSLIWKGRDVVLGFDNVGDYRRFRQNFGATVGRYVGRINGARFTLDGQEYHLQDNGRGVISHGGYPGFADRVWDVLGQTDSTLTLQYVSPDGENGFPGTLTLTLTVKVTTAALELQYEATTDKPTVLNLTNHSFFNLSGDMTKTIEGELLFVNSEAIARYDENKNLDGGFMRVDGTPFDFISWPRLVGERIDEDFAQLKVTNGYDHSFLLKTAGNDQMPAAWIYDPVSNIRMTVYTTEPDLHIYAGNGLKSNMVGKYGTAYPRRSGICFETMHFSDSPNQPQFPSTVLRPGETYRSHTAFVFE